MIIIVYNKKNIKIALFNPHTPVAQKVAYEVVFRRFQGEGVEFFLNRTSLTPSNFGCASFGKYQLKPSQLSFFSGFYTKIMFRYQDY